ncbi:MAG: GNAT family N-acetyltransferase [Rhodocyclaceae bacterium]|nr:GNAT family N-acetyltransferase [Rhodocyclaceae bacterium]
MQIDLLDSACELSDADWQRLATGGDPFISRAFLGAAEETGAAGTALAWQALHLALRDDAGRLAGLLPLYLREHSFGDFSRDWNWAPAWRQTGREYYPKLVSGVPYTPSPGPRLLACAGADASVAPALIDAARRLAGELRALVLAVPLRAGSRQAPAGSRRIAHAARRAVSLAQPRLPRLRRLPAGVQRGEAENSARAARRCRVRAAHRGPPRRRIDAPLWRGLYHRHYRDTFQRYGNHPAFKLEFFRRVGVELGRRMVVFVAWREAQQPVPSAILYRDDAALYGRHGAVLTSLARGRTEPCYYQGIEYAIRHGPQRLSRVRRASTSWRAAFEPVTTWVRLRIAGTCACATSWRTPAPRGQRDAGLPGGKWRGTCRTRRIKGASGKPGPLEYGEAVCGCGFRNRAGKFEIGSVTAYQQTEHDAEEPALPVTDQRVPPRPLAATLAWRSAVGR